MSTLQNKNCQARHHKGRTIYKYWNTDVAEVHDKYVVLNNGGFQNQSTKRLMNSVLELHSSNWYISQNNFEWFTYNKDTNQTIKFRNGIKLYHSGAVRYEQTVL